MKHLFFLFFLGLFIMSCQKDIEDNNAFSPSLEQFDNISNIPIPDSPEKLFEPFEPDECYSTSSTKIYPHRRNLSQGSWATDKTIIPFRTNEHRIRCNDGTWSRIESGSIVIGRILGLNPGSIFSIKGMNGNFLVPQQTYNGTPIDFNIPLYSSSNTVRDHGIELRVHGVHSIGSVARIQIRAIPFHQGIYHQVIPHLEQRVDIRI